MSMPPASSDPTANRAVPGSSMNPKAAVQDVSAPGLTVVARTWERASRHGRAGHGLCVPADVSGVPHACKESSIIRVPLEHPLDLKRVASEDREYTVPRPIAYKLQKADRAVCERAPCLYPRSGRRVEVADVDMRSSGMGDAGKLWHRTVARTDEEDIYHRAPGGSPCFSVSRPAPCLYIYS